MKTKIPRELYPEVRANFEKGSTRRALAEYYECSVYTICRVLRRAGVPKHTRHDPHSASVRVRRKKVFAEIAGKETLEQMYCEECLSLREMANVFGTAHMTVYLALKRFNIKLRRKETKFALPEELNDMITKDYRTLGSMAKIASKYGVSQGVISRVLRTTKENSYE